MPTHPLSHPCAHPRPPRCSHPRVWPALSGPRSWLRAIFLVFALLGAFPAAAATEQCSLVVGGQILDVACIRDPASGMIVAARALELVARSAGDISLSVRPDRGHIALGSPAPGGSVASITGFNTSTLTVIINGQPSTLRAQLLSGVLYLEAMQLQTILEKLEFSVLIAPDTALISVFRTRPVAPADASGDRAGEAGGGSGVGAPGAGMLEAVQRASSSGLEAVVVAGGSSSTGSAATSGSSAEVCAAMDRLRVVWEQTEPSMYEKQTMKELSEIFQKAKESPDLRLEADDVQRTLTVLRSFQQKVETRKAGTRAWAAPGQAKGVQTYGNAFLDSVAELMNQSLRLMEAIDANDKGFKQRAEEEINALKGLEQTIQQQGMSFDREVTRVRGQYGCGPAKLGQPPS